MRLTSLAILSFLLLANSCSTNSGLTQLEDFTAVLKKAGNTTTYQMLVFAAGGMPQVLGSKTKGTLIVPTDDAFNLLGGQALMKLMDVQQSSAQVELLKKHVLKNAFSPKKLASMGNVPTLQGSTIPVKMESNVLTFGDAKVISSWQTPEGMVYIVNKVLQ